MNFGSQRGSRFLNKKQGQDANPYNETNWIGSQAHEPSVSANIFETEQKKLMQSSPQVELKISSLQSSPEKSQLSIGNKSPVDLMQDILRSVRNRQQFQPYYSKQSQESLAQLLTNKIKLSNYIKRLQREMVGLDNDVVKNYQILILLLQQMSSADVEIRQNSQSMQINFNRTVIQRQQAQLQRLQRERDQRQKQMKFIVQEYETIISNFNQVIQKLVAKDQGRLKYKF